MDEYERYRAGQARAWLSKCRRLVRMQEALSDTAAQQRALAEGLAGIDYSRAAVRASPYADRIPDAVAMASETADRLAALAVEVSDMRERAAGSLLQLADPTEAAALTRYYLQGWKWERVCVEMGYSYPRMMEIHRSALLHAYDVMPPCERDPMEPAL